MQNFLALIKFRQKPLFYSLYLSFSFLILCSFYIWASGEIAANIAKDIIDLKSFELYKGLVFVSLTSLLIFVLCFIFLKKLSQDAEELLKSQEIILQTEHRGAAGIFASCLAHDANNILAVISLRTEQLKLMTDLSHESSVIIEKLKIAVEKLIAMMVKLKDSGSTNLGKPTHFDFKHMAEETLEMVSHHKSLMRTNLETSIPPGAYDYIGYPILFQQMLINLILNAAEAPRSVEEIIVKFSLKEEAQNFKIIIEDNGLGISEEDKEKIFSAFYSTKKTGSGLGLLSVRACLEQHSGEMNISKSSMGGAFFEINIPKSV